MPTLVAPPGVDLAAYCAQLRRALSQSGAAAPDAADRDGRLAEAAAAAPRHRARPARGRRARSRISRSRSPGWIRYASGTDERGGADRGVGSAGGEVRGDRRARGAAMPAHDRRRLSRSSSRCSATISPPTPRSARAVSARRRRAVPRRRARRRSPIISPREVNPWPRSRSFSIPTGCFRPIRRRASSRARSTRR